MYICDSKCVCLSLWDATYCDVTVRPTAKVTIERHTMPLGRAYLSISRVSCLHCAELQRAALLALKCSALNRHVRGESQLRRISMTAVDFRTVT